MNVQREISRHGARDLKALIAYMRTIKAVKKTTGLMYEVIQGTSGGYKDMKKEDALAAYLKSLPG